MREDVGWISLGGVMLLAAAQASHAAAVHAAKALGVGQGTAWRCLVCVCVLLEAPRGSDDNDDALCVACV